MDTLPNKLQSTSRRNFVTGLSVVIVAPLFGCGGGSSSNAQNEQLKEMLVERWNAKFPGRLGSLTIHMLAPNGEFFASTNSLVTPSAHFRGASVTKTFTAASIMLLVKSNKFKLTDKLDQVLSIDIPYKREIDVSQLLNHTAGVFDLVNNPVPKNNPKFPLADQYEYAGKSYLQWVTDNTANGENHSFTKDELIGVLVDTQLYHSKPGDQFKYSDQHYTVLGKIVEVHSGMPLNDFIATNFLSKNGLDQINFVTDGSQWSLPAPYIRGYTIDSGSMVERETTEYNYSYDPGSGNLVTNTANLVRWIRKLVKGEMGLSETTINEMVTITKPSTYYGLGLKRMMTPSGVMLGWGHTGGTEGYLTDAYHDPMTDVSYVLQCSLYDSSGTTEEAIWMAETALNARNIIGY